MLKNLEKLFHDLCLKKDKNPHKIIKVIDDKFPCGFQTYVHSPGRAAAMLTSLYMWGAHFSTQQWCSFQSSHVSRGLKEFPVTRGCQSSWLLPQLSLEARPSTELQLLFFLFVALSVSHTHLDWTATIQNPFTELAAGAQEITGINKCPCISSFCLIAFFFFFLLYS